MTGSPITVVSGAATHPGMRRTMNEDAYLAHAPLFLVADGMGGHQAGDAASATVVAEFGRLAGRTTVAVDDLHAALERAKARVDALSDGPRPAGSTLTGVAVSEVDGAGYWLAINIGDSRTYRFAGGALEQISVDHSMVQELHDLGAHQEAEAARRNVITRAIGAGSDSDADFWMLPARLGDRLLICSDGLTTEVEDDRISVILATEADPRRAAACLVHEALENGGRDNVTVVVVDAIAVEAVDLDEDTFVGSRGIDEDTLPRTVGAR